MGIGIPVATPATIRGIFRCIVRHCNHIESPNLVQTIKRQFLRRRKVAKIGHIRAAYNLESSLREVCAGTKSLDDLRNEFSSTPKKSTYEKNAHGKYKLWIQHESRQLDAYNAPPPIGQERNRVDRMAKLNNRRWNYIDSFMPGLRKLDFDPTFVDTVLAPAHYCKPKPKEDLGPRRVDLKTITRSGELSLLKVSGLRPRGRGFKMHMQRVLRDIQPRIDQLDAQIQLARDYTQEDAQFSEWVALLSRARYEESRKLREKKIAMEVHRRILVRRQQELQQQWNWRRDRTLSKRADVVAKPHMRLDDL